MPESTQQDLTKLLAEIVGWEKRRRAAEDDLEHAKKIIADLTPIALERMGLAGIDRLTIEGLTAFPRSTRYVRNTMGTGPIVETLKNLDGWEYLVVESYNANSLKSAVLEVIDSGGDLPSELGCLLEVEEKVTLGFRAG